MIVTTQQLKEKYVNYADPIGKIFRDVKKGELFPLVKGMYETDSNVSGNKLAQFIYGPSYLSFDFALYYYGLIPEMVYKTFTCSTYNKRKTKIYENHFGTFIYKDIPKKVFPYGVILNEEGKYTYHIATPEKAICDKLYSLTPVGNVKELEMMLFEDLRIDETEFEKLNKDDIIKIAPMYKSKNLNLLLKFIKGEK